MINHSLPQYTITIDYIIRGLLNTDFEHTLTDAEIKVCMSLLFDGSIIEKIKRNIRENSITVEFMLMNCEEKRMYDVSLLPDCIEQLSDGVRVKQDGLYHYQQFTIAKGYSKYWKDNIFV